MIMVTGGAGFIGSNYIKYLNSIGITDILVVDSKLDNYKNLEGLKYTSYLDKNDINETTDLSGLKAIIHLGATSDTMASSELCYDNNYKYTLQLFFNAIRHHVPFIYASSASVYGNNGTPLNYYAVSKLMADITINNRAVGLRFFNVYGPNESHKGEMRSFITKICDGNMKLFRGTEQSARDYIYIKDVVKIIDYFRIHYKPGIYDVGTGTNITYNEIFKEIGKVPNMIDMPKELEGKLQVGTKADLGPLRTAGYVDKFYSLKEALKEMKQ